MQSELFQEPRPPAMSLDEVSRLLPVEQKRVAQKLFEPEKVYGK